MKMQKSRLWIGLGAVNVIVLVLVWLAAVGQKQGSIVFDGITVDGILPWEKTDDAYLAEYPLDAASIAQGVYTVKIQYTTECSGYRIYYSTDRDGKHYPALYSDRHALDDGSRDISFRIWVNSKTDHLNLCVERKDAFEDPEETLRIEHMEINRENTASGMYRMVKMCMVLLVFNAMVIAVFKRNALCRGLKDNIYVILGLGCIFFISSCSVFSGSLSYGHDLEFHLARIIGLGEEISRGSLPVRIQSVWNNGYGYPVSVFYGDVLLYIPAILYVLKVPVIYAYKFYVLCINAGTVGIAFYCYKKLSGDRNIGVACTALYCLSVNRILNVCLRAAVGEYSAYMFFPLVLLGVVEIFRMDQKKPAQNYGWVYLCAGMTGIIHTHVLSFEMVCLLLGTVVLLLARRALQKDVMIAFIKSAAVAVCLSLGFLLPFLDYSRQNIVVFREKANYGIQGLGLSLYELFSLGTAGAGEATLSVEGLEDRFPESLGLAIVIVMIVSLIMLVRWRWERSEKKVLIFSMGIAGLVLLMSTYYFPWNRLAAVPLIRNIVSSIQFPWRFVSISIPVLAYIACLLLMKMKATVPSEKLCWVLAGICVVSAVQGLQCTDMVVRHASGFVMYDGRDILQKESTVMGGEYLLENTDLSMALGDPNVSGQGVEVSEIHRDGGGIRVSCKASQGAYLEFPLFEYKHYSCTDVQTGEEYNITRGENNRIRVELPAGYQGSLKVCFKVPWYWRTAEAVSMGTLITVVIYLLFVHSRDRKRSILGLP